MVHIVKRGDTIDKIAKQYGVSPERIITDNAISDTQALTIGQALLILIPETIHTVKQGETLASIADLYNTNVITLIQNNPDLAINPTIEPGQVLTIKYKQPKERNVNINGYAYPFIDMRTLMQTLPYLTTLTIFGYGFDENGDLINIDDDKLINLAYQSKVAPIMLLSSINEEGVFSGERASQLFNSPEMQNHLIEQVIAKMKEKGYQGLDIDFEYVKPEDKQAYKNFVQNFTQKLNDEGFTVNVDLAPKTSDTQKGLLYEAHDYKELGDIANTSFAMTYEWGYTYGPPMAVAPIDNVEKVIDYAITEIPNEKILMGIPNYGYDWTLPYQMGMSKATTIGNEEAIQLAKKYGSRILYDEKSQTPYFTYIDEQKRAHIVWFEDARSIRAKLNLLNEMQLSGAGYWNVMRPFIQNWLLVNSMFNINKIVK